MPLLERWHGRARRQIAFDRIARRDFVPHDHVGEQRRGEGLRDRADSKRRIAVEGYAVRPYIRESIVKGGDRNTQRGWRPKYPTWVAHPSTEPYRIGRRPKAGQPGISVVELYVYDSSPEKVKQLKDALREANGAVLNPEVFSRTDGTTYVSAINSETALPDDPAQVVPDHDAIERLQAMCRRLFPALAETNIVARQACYRPVTQDGLPLIGKVPHSEGVYVAAGHSVWGILNAPATAEAMAELIVDGVAHNTDLTPFDPRRLRPLLWRGLGHRPTRGRMVGQRNTISRQASSMSLHRRVLLCDAHD